MNKFKKIGIMAVSVVMSSAMVFSLAACGGGSDDDDDDDDYTALEYTSDTQIGIAIGYQTYDTGAFYTGESNNSYALSGTMTVSGGYQASAGTLKPAMYAIQEALDVKFVDGYKGLSTANNLTNESGTGLVDTNVWGSSVVVATSDLSVAVSQAASKGNMLNLGDYLDQMPNFKAFLEENPVVYLSLLQSGMSTTTGEGKEIYVAPYFDGNDDIERYCLMRQDWVEDLLDDDLSYDGDTFASICGTSTSVSGGWMGTTGSYEIETSTEADSGATTFTLVKDYAAAKTAVTTSGTDLYNAYMAITNNVAYTGTSGNIVDIMNAAINAVNGNVSGKKLATLYRAYIDVAYKNKAGGAAYTTRSDLFNGYSAAWDVDDLVTMLRIVKTNSANVGLTGTTKAEGIFPRTGDNDRTPDMVRLAAQLYGERGADSRYEYTYIDNNGDLIDARQNTSFWECLESFGELYSEGLVYQYYTATGGSVVSVPATAMKGDGSNLGYGFMEYDYSQTQTTQMFADAMADEDYLFGAVNTPVSKWDVDGDGTKEVTMRFTESWRSTKTSGLCVAASVANDKNLLNAVLSFIDYLYSNDGQITSTFGIQASSKEGTDGTWYGNYVSSAVDSEYCEYKGGQWVVKDAYKSSYFTYEDKLYTGTLYKGEMTPTVTEGLYTDFTTAASVEGSVNAQFDAYGNFTSYARRVLGATLPMGVKNQSFENQLTAKAAATEASKVGVSISNGTIKHVTLEVNSSSYWYTSVPTGLPLNSRNNAALTDSSQSALRGMSGTNIANSKNFYAVFHHIIAQGYTGTYNQQSVTINFGEISDASDWVSVLNNSYGLTTRATIEATGWSTAKGYWEYLSSVL